MTDDVGRSLLSVIHDLINFKVILKLNSKFKYRQFSKTLLGIKSLINFLQSTSVR